jgi:hypothetical protein
MDFMYKPFDGADLLRAIGRALDEGEPTRTKGVENVR